MFWKIINRFRRKKRFTIADMQWSFKQGLHEGILRTSYKYEDKEDSFEKSEFDFYFRNYYPK